MSKQLWYQVRRCGYGESRMRTLLVLWDSANKGEEAGLTLGELTSRGGLAYAYVKKRIKLWVEWRFIKRVGTKMGNGSLRYLYSLASRGRKVIESLTPEEIRGLRNE
ncbi:hypothetical protein ACFLWX_02705 [Chloroflexota bacterium]